MSVRVCRRCNKTWEHNKRGRAPVLCSDCADVKDRVEVQCQKCRRFFEPPKTPGRRPSLCPECKEDKDKSSLPRAPKKNVHSSNRADILEMMLRSRGTHIEQHWD